MGSVHMWRLRIAAVSVGVAVSLVAMSAGAIPATAAINGGPQLTFPWGAPYNPDGSNSNGRFNYGPHDYNGIDTNQHNHSWNSLDLAPADNRVYAARGGYAYVECGGERIRVEHGDGYITTYLHLYPPSVRIASGTYVARDTWLARVILTSDHYTENCGTGSQNHVHFSLWYVPLGDTFSYLDRQAVDWGALQPTAATPVAGQPQIGDWTVDDGIPAVSYSGCMTSLASPGVRYCGLYQGVTTYIFNDWLSEQVPTARRPGGQTEDLFMRGLSIHGFQVPTDTNGNPTEAWVDLGGWIKGSPTGVWNSSTTELDVFAIGTGDGIYYKRWKSSSGWDANWTPTALVAGTTMTETVNSERIGDNVELYFEGSGGDAQIADFDSSLNLLGQPVSIGSPTSPTGIGGAPSGRWNSSGTRLDVFVIGSDNHPYRRSERCDFPPCVWDSRWTQLPGTAASAGTSSSGITAGVTEMVMSVRAPDDTIDLFFRGTANDAIHESLDQFGNFLQSETLGGVIKGAPDAKWDAYKSRLDVFAIGTNNQVWQDTWTQGSSPPWSGWRLLPGGGVWG